MRMWDKPTRKQPKPEPVQVPDKTPEQEFQKILVQQTAIVLARYLAESTSTSFEDWINLAVIEASHEINEALDRIILDDE